MGFFSNPDPDTSFLILVRHGATTANLERPNRLQGQRIDLPLSDEGRRQAEAVARLLASHPLARVLSSPLKRAMETADAIASPHEVPVESVAALIECDVGRWEGMSWEAIEHEDPVRYRAFMSDPTHDGYAGGENFAQVHDRVAPVLGQLLEEARGTTVAVVGHNVVNRVCLADILGVPSRLSRHIVQHNGGVNVIRWRAGETTLITLNSIWHLE